MDVTTLVVSGDDTLADLSVFDTLVDNDAPPLDTAEVKYDPALPYDSVTAALDMIGTNYRDVWGPRRAASLQL